MPSRRDGKTHPYLSLFIVHLTRMNDYKMYSKLVMSGGFVELLKYRLPLRITRKINKSDFESYILDKKAPSISRSRSTLRRLIYSNAGTWRDKNGYLIPIKFLTLTFQENIQDLKTANKYLTKFVQRLNYRFANVMAGNLKYVCVPEFQKRGAIHYHLVLFNFPFIDRIGLARLRACWGDDRIHLVSSRRDIDISNIIGYISKYITKQSDDDRFRHQKRYFASRGIKKPVILRDDVAIHMIGWNLRSFEIYKKVFNVPFVGDIEYRTYYLGDNRNIESLPLDPYAREKITIAKIPIKRIELIRKICVILSIAANRPSPKTGKLCLWTPKKKNL